MHAWLLSTYHAAGTESTPDLTQLNPHSYRWVAVRHPPQKKDKFVLPQPDNRATYFHSPSLSAHWCEKRAQEDRAQEDRALEDRAQGLHSPDLPLPGCMRATAAVR